MLFRSDRKSTRLNSSHTLISYAVFCLKKKKHKHAPTNPPQQAVTLRDDQRSHQPSPGLIKVLLALQFVIPFARFSGLLFFFFNDPATTEIYPLPLHDALPI